ncbi:MAG: DUF1648 domain-containing protein, partial [Betaproteobacteria bacterium]|nr:DUF1648 domain-containing protein [Betaproteobacteria bacterium]
MLAGFIACSAAIIVATSGALPERVATHFAFDGRANGWMTRDAYAWMMGILARAAVRGLAPRPAGWRGAGRTSSTFRSATTGSHRHAARRSPAREDGPRHGPAVRGAHGRDARRGAPSQPPHPAGGRRRHGVGHRRVRRRDRRPHRHDGVAIPRPEGRAAVSARKAFLLRLDPAVWAELERLARREGCAASTRRSSSCCATGSRSAGSCRSAPSPTSRATGTWAGCCRSSFSPTHSPRVAGGGHRPEGQSPQKRARLWDPGFRPDA